MRRGAAPRVGLVALLLGLRAAAPAFAGDAAAGAKVFATECAECHSVREGKDKKGPSLFAIVGAKAARREGERGSRQPEESPAAEDRTGPARKGPLSAA